MQPVRLDLGQGYYAEVAPPQSAELRDRYELDTAIQAAYDRGELYFCPHCEKIHHAQSAEEAAFIVAQRLEGFAAAAETNRLASEYRQEGRKGLRA